MLPWLILNGVLLLLLILHIAQAIYALIDIGVVSASLWIDTICGRSPCSSYTSEKTTTKKKTLFFSYHLRWNLLSRLFLLSIA